MGYSSVTRSSGEAFYVYPRRGAPRLPVSARPAPAAPALFAGRSLSLAVTRLAWPITVENLLQSALTLVDLRLVAALGTAAVAGVGTATQILWLALSAGAAVSIGATVLIAQAVGRDDGAAANYITRQAILLALGLGCLVALAAPFSEAIIAALGPEPEVVRLGSDYLRVSLGGFVLVLLMFVGSACLRGAGDTRTPMLVTAGVNVVHAVAAYLLIFGAGSWPGMGAVGSAWAAVVARGLGAAVMFGLLAWGGRSVSIQGWAGWRIDLPVMGRLMRLGLPSALEQVIISGGFLVYSAMVIPLGTVAFATQRITFTLISLSFMPGMGYSMAATTLTGQALGARRPDLARRSTWIAVAQAAGLMTAAAVVFFFAGGWLVSFFSDDPEVIALGADGLKVLAVSQPSWALAQVLAGGLRGGGDTRFPMWTSLAGMWLLRLPFGYGLGIVAGYGLPGVYASAIVDASFRAALGAWRFAHASWLTAPPAPGAVASAPPVTADD